MENKYSRGKIYLIRNKNNEELIYVGSSIEIYLSKRFNKHKYQNCCSLYNYINNPENNTNWDDWYIELYEEFPCENKLQLCKRENEIIREKATINKIGFRTEEMKKEKDKQYRDTHKEKIKEINKIYVENNKDKINEKHKQYQQKYYQNNKNEILKKLKEKIICNCGCKVLKCNLKKHQQTLKHINLINNII